MVRILPRVRSALIAAGAFASACGGATALDLQMDAGTDDVEPVGADGQPQTDATLVPDNTSESILSDVRGDSEVISSVDVVVDEGATENDGGNEATAENDVDADGTGDAEIDADDVEAGDAEAGDAEAGDVDGGDDGCGRYQEPCCQNSACDTPLACMYSGAVLECLCPYGPFCDAMCTSNDPNNCGTCGHKCLATQKCSNGQCVCPDPTDQVCNGACINVGSDPNNCGGCGLQCSVITRNNNAICVDQVCRVNTPLVFDNAQGLALDDLNIYYSTPSSVISLPKLGGPPVTLSPSSSGQLLLVDSLNIYWSVQSSIGTGGIYYCAIAGCIGAPISLITGINTVAEFAQDAATLYWSVGRGIFSCPKAGCNNQPFAISQQDQAYSMAVDSSNIYWWPQYGQAIETCPLSGCTGSPGVFLNQGYGPIAVNGGTLYGGGVIGYSGAMISCSTANCQATVTSIVPNWGDGRQLLVEPPDIYWSYANFSGINKVPIAGGPVTGFTPDFPIRIAVDSANLYWTDGVAVWQTAR